MQDNASEFAFDSELRAPERPVLKIVVPCYNESEVLLDSAGVLKEVLDSMIASGAVSGESRVVFVNDGSSDDTWEKISALANTNPRFAGLCLSKNFGHQSALIAGLMSVDADVYVTIDADLQDDPWKIVEMVEQWKNGCDIVLGVRSSRETDSFFKRFTAVAFYRLMRALGVKTVENHADYRLMSRRAVRALAAFPERNLFLRGMITLLGFRRGEVFYARAERTKGETKYPFKKMLALALDGITSFCVAPLRAALVIGGIMLFAAVALFAYAFVSYLVDDTVRGWSSLIATVLLVGSAQTFILVILGEYVGKIYFETKRRPVFLLRDKIERPFDDDSPRCARDDASPNSL